jgi:hypothetical protein
VAVERDVLPLLPITLQILGCSENPITLQNDVEKKGIGTGA